MMEGLDLLSLSCCKITVVYCVHRVGISNIKPHQILQYSIVALLVRSSYLYTVPEPYHNDHVQPALPVTSYSGHGYTDHTHQYRVLNTYTQMHSFNICMVADAELSSCCHILNLAVKLHIRSKHSRS